MTWDALDRLIEVQDGGAAVSFDYRADGMRESKTVNSITTHYIYAGQAIVASYSDNAPTVITHYLVGASGVAGTMTMDDSQIPAQGGYWPSYQFYLYDGTGSVVGLVDRHGDIINDSGSNASMTSRLRGYDAYGSGRTTGGGPWSTSGYVGVIGHLADDDCGLIYMRARYYDPALGRFISEDPGRNGANWYAYCGSNPMGGVDIDGRFDIPFLADIAIGGILIKLGEYMVGETENQTLGYILGASGALIGGIGAALAIKSAIDWAGPMLSRYVDRITNQLWQNMNDQAQHQAESFAGKAVQASYGYELMVEGYIMEAGGD